MNFQNPQNSQNPLNNHFQASMATNNVLAYLMEGCKANLPTNDIEARLHKEIKDKNFIPNLDHNCLSCSKKDVTKRCGNCHSVYYCDEVCARKAWPSHKPQCGRNLFMVCVCCGTPDFQSLAAMMPSRKIDSKNHNFKEFKNCEKCPVRYCSTQCKDKFRNEHEKDCERLAELDKLIKATKEIKTTKVKETMPKENHQGYQDYQDYQCCQCKNH